MVDKHNQSFFGQSTGMFIQSSSKHEPFIFLQFIKKKGEGSWEKPSQREGKRVKCGLEEIIMIIRVLEKNAKSWTTVHNFKDDKTPISIKWEGEQKIWINVGDYPKMLSYSQIEIMRLLLQHILQEKIEFATVPEIKSRVNKDVKVEKTVTHTQEIRKEDLEDTELIVVEEISTGEALTKVQGIIAGETEKAILLKLNGGAENWFPKSTIKSQYLLEKEISQTFMIDSWIIEKNKIAV
jgi:hypothetical protein